MISPLSVYVDALIHSRASLANSTFNLDFHASELQTNHSIIFLDNTSNMEAEFDLVGRVVQIIHPIPVSSI
jgi:hypothetical protein